MSENKTRTITYMYGEPTAPVSILVPESKKPEILAKFYKILEEYHNPKVVEVEIVPKPKKVLSEQNLTQFQDSTDKIRDGRKEKTFSELAEEVSTNLPKSVKNIVLTAGIPVSALPKDRKRIEPGLYSGEGKFFTNKIVDNELVILQWPNEKLAKEYLDNLKK